MSAFLYSAHCTVRFVRGTASAVKWTYGIRMHGYNCTVQCAGVGACTVLDKKWSCCCRARWEGAVGTGIVWNVRAMALTDRQQTASSSIVIYAATASPPSSSGSTRTRNLALTVLRATYRPRPNISIASPCLPLSKMVSSKQSLSPRHTIRAVQPRPVAGSMTYLPPLPWNASVIPP